MRYLTQEHSSGKRLPHMPAVQAGGYLAAVPWGRGPENRETPGERPGDWELDAGTSLQTHVQCAASKTPLFFADGSYTTEEEGAAWRVLRTLMDRAGARAGAHVWVGPARLPSKAQGVAVLPLLSKRPPPPLDFSCAAASRSDLALCSVGSLVYILYQGFCDT